MKVLNIVFKYGSKNIYLLSRHHKLMLNKNKIPTTVVTNDISDSELRDTFREAIIGQTPDIDKNVLEKQIDFMVERTNNHGNETLSQSEIADQAYKIGLTYNNFVNRKAVNTFDFSAQ